MNIKRPLIIPALIFAAVSLTAVFVDVKIALVISIVSVLICGLLCIIYKRELWIYCTVCILLTVSLAGNYSLINKVYEFSNSQLQICGEVTDVQASEYGVNNTVRITKGELYGSRISVFSQNACFGVGDNVNITVKPYANENRSDLAEKVFAKGKIIAVNSIDSYPDNFLETMRNSVIGKMFACMPTKSAAVLSALLIGERDYLSPEFEASVKNAGLTHMLVVSGMHMAILIGGLLIILDKSRLPKWAASIIGVMSTLFFMAVCGFTPSVMRAGIMYLIIIFARVVLRKNDSVSSLCAAVLIISLINPFIFGSVSFLLSVSATAGVLVLYPKLSEKVNVKNKFLSGITDAVLVSVAAVVCTAPVSLIFFGTVNVMSVITSVLVSFAVTGALIIGVFGVIFSFIPQIGIVSRFLFFIADILLKIFISVVEFFG